MHPCFCMRLSMTQPRSCDSGVCDQSAECVPQAYKDRVLFLDEGDEGGEDGDLDDLEADTRETADKDEHAGSAADSDEWESDASASDSEDGSSSDDERMSSSSSSSDDDDGVDGDSSPPLSPAPVR